jgi:hypothetical protein
MDIQVLAILLAMLLIMAAAAFVIPALVRLLGPLDPSAQVRGQVSARVAAIEATLLAIRHGLIKIPRVYRRTLE